MGLDLKKEILKGKIFIYPTDTIYGIGCNALNKNAVKKIREIKQRDNKPFSVIAPSFNWIRKHCIVNVDLKKYLPGKYTIILKKKNKRFLKWVSSNDSLGVRIPNNEFTKEIQKTGLPFITTSVNFSGKKFCNEIKKIHKEILNKVDYIINSGKLSGKPSTLVIGGKIIRRK